MKHLSDAQQEPSSSESTATSSSAPARSALRRYRGITAGLAVTDALCIVVALLGSYVVRFGLEIGVSYSLALAVAPLAWVAIFHGFGLYAPQQLSAVEEFRRIFSASSVGIVLLVMSGYWSKADFSRLWIGVAFLAALGLEMAARRLWRGRIDRLRRAGHLRLRTLVVGTNKEAHRVGEVLSGDLSLGYQPLGFVETRTIIDIPADTAALVHLDQITEAIEEHGVECLFVASTSVSPEDMMWVSQAARQCGAEVKVSANMPEILSSRVSVQQIGDMMALSLRPVRLTGTQAVIKRTFDLVISAPALLLSLPVLVLIAILVRSTSRGPVLYRQERVTKNHRRFTAYKFRTMLNSADELLRGQDVDPTAPFFKLGQEDPRVTRLGRFLRRSSLDELPQLWNVVLGHMSLVGPRPLPTDQIEANLELLGPRLEVPGGLTGWWQVSGRSDVSAGEAIKMDTFYIENWSLALDLFILMKTAGVIIRRTGAV